MIDMFAISHHTDGKTVCRIVVEPGRKQCGVMITVDSRIVRIADERDPTFRSVASGDWSDIPYWEKRARDLAQAHSPFWRGESAA